MNLIDDIVYLQVLTLPRVQKDNGKIQSKCTHCGELHDDENCELIHGLVFCSECLNAFEKWGDGIEEEIKQYMNKKI